MSKFEFTVKTYFSSLEEVIEHWFQKHFSNVTPGTPDHAVLTAAKEGLKADLGLAASDATGPQASPEANPAPEPTPEPAPEPAPETPAEPSESPAETPEE